MQHDKYQIREEVPARDILLRASDVKRSFPLDNGERISVLKGVSIEVPRGGLTILKGRSGSGKTTFLNILGCLDRPDSGEIYLNGDDLVLASAGELDDFRRKKYGFIFQSVALVPMMTALENVELALRLVGQNKGRRERAIASLKSVGLGKRLSHYPNEMSGGEQQRVAIARAMVHQPQIILADEPTGELDTQSSLQVVKLLKDLTVSEGITILMTTHNVEIMEVGDAIYEIKDGEINGYE